MEEIRNCPFCGEEAIISETYDSACINGIECSKCDAFMYGEEKEKLIEVWNRRVEK